MKQKHAIKEIEALIQQCVKIAEANSIEFMGFCTSSDDELSAVGSVNASPKFIAETIVNMMSRQPAVYNALIATLMAPPQE